MRRPEFKVFAVHTIYFWSRPEPHLGEIFRVMASGGRLVLCYHPLEDGRFANAFPASVYVIRPVKEIETLAVGSGFEAVRTQTKESADGLMAWTIARKPEQR
jgi:hypothetical protein